MGFDINVSRFEGGVAAAIDQPTLQAFLARAGAVLDLRATYLVDFADGGALLLTADELGSDAPLTSCYIRMRQMSVDSCGFVVALAHALDGIIMNWQGTDEPTAASPVVIEVQPGQAAQLPEGIKHPGLATDGATLYALLAGTFAEWHSYRDRVLANLQRS
jgi:hypothetical protein